MTKKTFVKSCKGKFPVVGQAYHTVTLCKDGMVTGACPAVA